MKELPYSEGTWFAVPLRSGGYALGVVARTAPTGRVLAGYFFGPRRTGLPPIEDVRGLRPDRAVLVQRFGDLNLVQGNWPILGNSEGWNREEWPLPAFGRFVEIDGKAWRVEYKNEDPNSVPRETRISVAESRKLPNNALLGAGAVEISLTKLLSDWSATAS